ncbi:MAG: transcriptional regulator [Methylibium sp.]|nr:transcriptional regulator [Methylibium sp.]
MTQISQLMSTVKRQLKAQGLTYRDVARALHLSEPSVKRLFGSERMTLDRLAQIGELLGYTLAELLEESAASAPQVHVLTADQEARLVANDKLLLVAVCALNHWSLADIVAAYRLTKAECLRLLLLLDRMGLVALLPGDRIRLRVARDFDWLPHGPIRRFFREEGQPDFLEASFGAAGEMMEFAHGMLTQEAQRELMTEVRRLRARLAALHMESRAAPRAQRMGTGVLLALREWEPAAFRVLRRPREMAG